MTSKIKLTDDDIQIIKVKKTTDELKMFHDNDFYHVRFLSLEGHEIWWSKEEAEQLKQQILG